MFLSKLKLSHPHANEDGFWSYLSLISSPEVVRIRFGDTQNRYICGIKRWKHIYARLWWKAEIIEDPDPPRDDSYHLMNGVEEDYWVALLEREISSCRPLARQLNSRLFENEKEFDMDKRRKVIERARKLWPTYSIESICTGSA